MSLKGLSCIFPVPDIEKTAEYYVSKLGFRAVPYLECKEPHICLYREDAEIILLQANTASITPNRILYGYGYDAYLYTAAQESLEKEFAEKDVKFVRHLNTTDYQNREFVIEDIDGRWLAFGLKIKD
jgi:catechol 2,3-dioxygenase-like lactoylglutathione lyase family enzyme